MISVTSRVTRSFMVPVFWFTTIVEGIRGAEAVQGKGTRGRCLPWWLSLLSNKSSTGNQTGAALKETAENLQLVMSSVCWGVQTDWKNPNQPCLNHFVVESPRMHLILRKDLHILEEMDSKLVYLIKQGYNTASCLTALNPIIFLLRLCPMVCLVASLSVKGPVITQHAVEGTDHLGICLDAASYQQHLVNTDCKYSLMK